MVQTKRIVIFSPDKDNQRYIEKALISYLQEEFSDNYKGILLQKFWDINDSYASNAKVISGGEVAVILDSLLRKGDNYKRAGVILLEHLCKDSGIPYIDIEYRRDITESEESLSQQLKRFREPMSLRLQAPDYFKTD